MNSADYNSGAMAAFNMVLDYLNTMEDKIVAKSIIYQAVHGMRPPLQMKSEDYERLIENDIQGRNSETNQGC